MKPQHFALLAGGLLLLAVVLIVSGRPAQESRQTGAAAQAAAHSATVLGEGEIRVKPDTALITFGVVVHRASAAEAEALALASAESVRTALVQAGAEEDRVEISNLALVTETYQDYSGTTRISGFKGQVTVQGVLHNVAKARSVVEAGLAAGATSLDSVVYSLENPEPARQAAMKTALENARQRATALVKAEGEGLGALKSMEVLSEEAPAPASSPSSLVYRARVRATFEY